jgi:hypothetical protein
MAASSADIEVFAGAPEAEPPRPRVLLVGSALASGAAAMVVLALVAVYARMRADVIAGGDRWLPEDVTVQLSPGNMGMVTLLMSAVTVAWAVYSLRNDDRVHAYLAFGLSILLGAATSPPWPTAGSSSAWASPARRRRCSSSRSPGCTWP